ncbi:MAG: response regulator [Deltaproteobacteria bacterium]|nr:MAG: response regulator [Deltaproteobacteria bacterium]
MPRKTILVVDDIPENIDVLVSVLREDFNVKVALNGPRALDIANQKPQPDLILLDVMMPEMDGYEVCQKLKSSFATQDIPVIFVTAKGEAINESKGFEVGGVDYVTKPILPLTLMARVKTQLSLYDQKRLLEEQVRQRTQELADSRLKALHCLGLAAEYKDNETGMHVVRMSLSCKLIALAAGRSEEEAERLLHVAPMHDVGKIGIPDHILLKPGKLTPSEWEIMKKHTVIGAKILGAHDADLLNEAQVIALTHHERWDGTGYPGGLRGADIPLFGRIAAIADVFDALVSERPYKEAWPVEDALEEIRRSSGSHFDPGLVEAFFLALPDILQQRELCTPSYHT